MTKCFIFLLIFFCAFRVQAQKKDRLYVNFGLGPSYSLYYKSGGWVRDWGRPNFNNIREERNIWGFSHFVEAEWRFQNPRWSIRGGYSFHPFSPRFQKEGYTVNGTYYRFDTKEHERNFYPQVTVHYAVLTGKNRLEISTGFYNKIYSRNANNYYERIVMSPSTTEETALFSRENNGLEAGFPVNVDYIHFLSTGNGIGARLNFNYTQSVRTAEHLALQLFFKAKLK